MARAQNKAIDFELLKEVEQFLFYEAELLDARRFGEWLDLLSDDLRYMAPMTRNVSSGGRGIELTVPAREVCWFDDDKTTLAQRVRQIESGEHWAEEPASRVCRMISNVQIHGLSATETTARDRFLIYQNRLETDQTLFIGRRETVLRKTGNARFLIAARTVWLPQSVLLAKNLSIFF